MQLASRAAITLHDSSHQVNNVSFTERRHDRRLSQFIQLTEQDPARIREELLAGLTAPHAHTSPKYLYDALGSRLFEAICDVPEYYPTRTEALIFDLYAAEFAATTGTGMTMIDLGAGNCAKAAKLFPHLQPEQYVPVDISVEFLRDAVERLQFQCPRIDMVGVGMDLSGTLDLPAAVRKQNRLFFYPGSSIGNFAPDDALDFLKRIHTACMHNGQSDGGILISADLIKDVEMLDAAYDDALGVTAAFNLNLLQHMNRLLESDFDLRGWEHRAFFNPEQSRIEMHLQAKSPQTVRWPGGVRRFDAGERIHTESSYKYTREEFAALLRQAGFTDVAIWTDPQEWFMVCHAKAGKVAI